MNHTLQRIQRNYTDPQVTVALETLAANSGNLTATKVQLEQEGWEISKDRLKRWMRKEHVGRYREARLKAQERIKEDLADKHHAAAFRDLKLEEEVTERLQAKLKAGELKPEAELTLKGKAGLGSAIHTDKGQQLNGEHQPLVQVNITQIQANLAKKGIKVSWDYEVEAEEIPSG